MKRSIAWIVVLALAAPLPACGYKGKLKSPSQAEGEEAKEARKAEKRARQQEAREADAAEAAEQ